MFAVRNREKSLVLESYKGLRSNLQYALIEKGNNVLLFTSPNMQEGKTTVAVNTAIEFSKINKSVILVDCNLRNPSIKEKLQLSNNEGFADIVLGNSELKTVIEEYNENLAVISAGSILSGQTEILSSNQTKKVIGILKGFYDVVIIDSPALLKYSDAQILSTIVDATILVVKADSTNKRDCENSKKILNNIGKKFSGTVLFAKK